ncbi:MAG: hypothetical protein ACUZ8I_10410 [Candidatus Scalindua sp.]
MKRNKLTLQKVVKKLDNLGYSNTPESIQKTIEDIDIILYSMNAQACVLNEEDVIRDGVIISKKNGPELKNDEDIARYLSRKGLHKRGIIDRLIDLSKDSTLTAIQTLAILKVVAGYQGIVLDIDKKPTGNGENGGKDSPEKPGRENEGSDIPDEVYKILSESAPVS